MSEPLILLPLELAPARLVRRSGVVERLSGATMGTRWSLAVVSEGVEGIEALVRRELDAVIAEMSQWAPESELSRFNGAEAGSWHDLSPGLFHVLRAGLALARRTEGVFDPTIGAVADLWGFGAVATEALPPPVDAIERARAVSGWQRLGFDSEGRRARQPGGLRLDLSGIAKGHAVDRVALALEQAGYDAFLIEIGGELAARGVKPEGEPWWVDCEMPPDADLPPARIGLVDGAAATSGNYRRYLEVAGTRMAHTLDPRTGAPLADPPASVTVLHAECMIADALATAITVLGVEPGIALAEDAAAAAIIVHRDEQGWHQTLSSRARAMAEA